MKITHPTINFRNRTLTVSEDVHESKQIHFDANNIAEVPDHAGHITSAGFKIVTKEDLKQAELAKKAQEEAEAKAIADQIEADELKALEEEEKAEAELKAKEAVKTAGRNKNK